MSDDLNQKLVHFHLDGAELDLLREVGKILAPKLDETLTLFYTRVQADPSLAGHFASDERISFARGAQKRHWERLLSGTFDAEYRASVDRIGRTHARIDLPLDVYMSAYSLASSDLIQTLTGLVPWRKRARLGAMIGVLTRAFALDIERVVATFFRIQAEEQTIALTHIGLAIDKLAEGDLTHVIPGPEDSDFPVSYDPLRLKLTHATQKLQSVISDVTGAMGGLVKLVEEVTGAANDLAERTATQAASLEQTAAAVHELTENVSNSAVHCTDANAVAMKAETKAVEGVNAIGNAGGAMSRIHTSSNEIRNIIGLIDDIAFQTNLLALNAGVEAARAGHAGRGFAVVAEEVRALASSASNAAREINKLVSGSASEVELGVDAIEAAAGVLQDIVDSFREVTTLSTSIANASDEQSRALAEANSAIGQMDLLTQRNAAMVEQTTAAVTMMQEKANQVAQRLATLKVGPGAPQPEAKRQPAGGTWVAEAPVPKAGRDVA